MLVIRLQRTGRTNLATYRLVLAESSRAAKGKFKEILGHYLPTMKEAVFEYNAERVAHWVKMGAIPSDTAARLLKRNGMDDMDKFIRRYVKRRSKNAPPEEEAPAAQPAAPVESAPVEQSAPEEAPAQAEAPETPAAPEAEAATPEEAPAEAAKEEEPAAEEKSGDTEEPKE